ncbi:MAG: TauD/TfdA family dioxygenase [Rhodospirillales bacterium]|nr:TauD/TfdA family dioxygenase [Rhodospirillales bacterium]
MSITVTPILPRFGAEVSGIDITGPLSEESKREIIDIQNRWGVTVWRDTGLNDDSHVAFTRIFGDVILAPKTRGRPRFAHPELFDASNLDADGNIVDDEHRRLTNRGNRLWHSDSSFVQERAAQSLLLCHEAPNGGPTWFADTRSAYDDLPQAILDVGRGPGDRVQCAQARVPRHHPRRRPDRGIRAPARNPRTPGRTHEQPPRPLHANLPPGLTTGYP